MTKLIYWLYVLLLATAAFFVGMCHSPGSIRLTFDSDVADRFYDSGRSLRELFS